MKLYPLKLKYACSTAIWGGERLKREWGKDSELSPLAETWELSCRDDGMMCRIENGEAAGLTLDEYIKSVGTCAVSNSYDGGRFPLLIKFIDAAKDLSVQVHPDDTYAAEHENDNGKTEMWYIVEADPGAQIVCGLADGVGREEFAAAVATNEYEKVLRYVDVKPGDVYFIPSGMAHAIGKGILIAEIQQNSDLTYRIYDYGRLGADGRPRQLHVEQAMAVVRPFTKAEIDGIRFERGYTEGYLANSRYFSVRLICAEKSPEFYVENDSFHCLLSVGGECVLTCGGEKYEISRGECVFLPAGLGSYSVCGDAKLLLSTL
jgi:mannose-6-phosphate isomerase